MILVMRRVLGKQKSLSQPGRASATARYVLPPSNGAPLKETFEAASKILEELPASDNIEGALDRMLRANAILRQLPWPKPFDETSHRVRCGDARDQERLG